jgi:gas vesicle protein
MGVGGLGSVGLIATSRVSTDDDDDDDDDERRRLEGRAMVSMAMTTTTTTVMRGCECGAMRRARRREIHHHDNHENRMVPPLSLTRTINRGRGSMTATSARGEYEETGGGRSGKGFVGGLLVGGAVFGALGFLFAPQLSKTLLGGKRALNKVLDEESEDELEVTRQNLNEKIAALNAAIDNFSDQAESGVEKNMSKLRDELKSMEEQPKPESA